MNPFKAIGREMRILGRFAWDLVRVLAGAALGGSPEKKPKKKRLP